MHGRLALPLALLALAAAAPAEASDRYGLKVRCAGKAMVATVTGANIKRVVVTTRGAREVVRRAPWSAQFARTSRVVAKANLTTRGSPVIRLEAKSPRC